MAIDFNSNYTMTINGKGVVSPGSIEVVNPATGTAFASAPDCNMAQLDEAVAAAKAAFKTWRKVPISERQALVRKAGDVLAAHADELARLFTREQGRPVDAAKQEILGAARRMCPRTRRRSGSRPNMCHWASFAPSRRGISP
jgi:acyl-CoA reductase-like NAD-dependent aldehyde dehydrogenase